MASDDKQPHVTEKESLRVAEASRQTEWEQPSFMRELFLGNFRLDLIHPFPLPGRGAPGVHRLLRRAAASSCATRSTPSRSTPPASTRSTCSTACARLGAFGMKIPKEYGGLGFTQRRVPEGHGAARQLRRQHRRRCSPRTSRSACRSRSSCSAPRSRRRSTCRAAPRARSPPSRSPSRTSAPTPRASRPPPSRRRTATPTSSTARSSGARTARSPSCSS